MIELQPVELTRLAGLMETVALRWVTAPRSFLKMGGNLFSVDRLIR
jgi:hypothetical protein